MAANVYFYQFICGLTAAVTLMLNSRSRKIDKDMSRRQEKLFPEFQDNRSSGLGGVQLHTHIHIDRVA